MHDPELQLEDEYEFGFESEAFAGEGEDELQMFADGEGAFGEGPLGEIEGEGMFELAGEGFGDMEDEQFFRKAFKRVASVAKHAAPLLKKVAGVAAPLVGTAIGGPLGGMIGSAAGNFIQQMESEDELAYEIEGESEAEMEAVMEGPITAQQALGEYMAAAASRAATDLEAEAHVGASTAMVLSRADLAALQSVLPNINRGMAVLTRVLRRQEGTRDGIRTIPTIVRRSALSLRRQAASGRPVTKASAARTVASQTRRVLGKPAVCAKAIQRNVQATKTNARAAARKQQQPQRYAL